VGAVAAGALAGAAPAQADALPFNSYSPRYLDVGPLVYSITVQSESQATARENVGGKVVTVQSQWDVSQESVDSKAGDQYDDEGNLIEYPQLPEVHVGYWVARYAADQFAKAQDRFENGTADDVVNFYNSVVNTPVASVKAYFAAGDAKAVRIAAVKADVLRNGKKAFNYVSYRPGKHGPADYVHKHKAAIAKHLNKVFAKSKLYKGTVKLKFTRDFVVQMGPTKADHDRQLHYTVTVRDTTDKVAYAIELNTHDGGAYGYGVYKTKY
jgi:hypothetical protein